MTDVGIGPVGDFLIVFQWVTLCRKRKGHDYFWMYLVTLVHMGTAGLQMPGLTYGFFFIAYAFLAISALAMSHAAKEARAAGVDFAPWEAAAPGTEPVAAPARIGGRFYLGALVATPAILIAVALLFIVMPRTSATGTIAPAILHLGQQPTSGFSNTVRLGAVGQIQEDPTPVMHVGIRDPKTGESLQVASLLPCQAVTMFIACCLTQSRSSTISPMKPIIKVTLPAPPMDFFAPIVPEERLNRTFKILSGAERYSPARELIKAMMRFYEDADGNFVEQFQTTAFDARIWELYLFAAFTELGYAPAPGLAVPDFLLSGLPGSLGIEATSVNPPDGGDIRPQPTRPALLPIWKTMCRLSSRACSNGS